MKIALCLEYPIDQHGGTEVLVSELIKGLGSRHQVVLVSPDTSASLGRSPVAPFVREHVPFSPQKPSVRWAKALADQVIRSKPDVVHFHFGGNYAWGARAFWNCPVTYFRRSHLPVVSTNHGAFSIFEGYCGEKRSMATKLALWFPAWLSKQYVLSHLETEIAVSRFDYQALGRWYPWSRHKFRWIYHSRLHGAPPPETVRREKIILCAGTIGERKGQWFLVDAFAHIAAKFPDWQLVFIGRSGDAMLQDRIQRCIDTNRLADRVKLLGPQSDDELRHWLGRAAIFAMPSLYEGLGLSLQEAQFYGCACIATRCGGTVDLIEDGDNGLLVPVADPGSLAVGLEKLMTDEALRQRFGRRAPESVLEKNMTSGKMTEAYERLYSELLGR